MYSMCSINKIPDNTSLGIRLNLRKIHHTPYKVVSCCDVSKDGF